MTKALQNEPKYMNERSFSSARVPARRTPSRRRLARASRRHRLGVLFGVRRQSGFVREEKTEDRSERDDRTPRVRPVRHSGTAEVGLNERMYIHKKSDTRNDRLTASLLPRRLVPNRQWLFGRPGKVWLGNDVDGDR
jgi:hypothetical protein